MAKRRPKLTTKEELLNYLKNNEEELPFNEEVWNLAVEKTSEKVRQYKETTMVDYDGSVKTKKVPNGAITPVGKYFQLMALPQYKKKAMEAFEETDEESKEEFEDDEQLGLDEAEKQEEIDTWLSIFCSDCKPRDIKFLKGRLSDYYDNYEINEGADKILVTKVVMDELEIMNLTKKRFKGGDIEARLEKVQKGYLSLLESLKALKKQRSAMDEEGKNKLTLWVDKLAKQGGFKPFKTEYEPDEIDIMLDIFTKNIAMVCREG